MTVGDVYKNEPMLYVFGTNQKVHIGLLKKDVLLH